MSICWQRLSFECLMLFLIGPQLTSSVNFLFSCEIFIVDGAISRTCSLIALRVSTVFQLASRDHKNLVRFFFNCLRKTTVFLTRFPYFERQIFAYSRSFIFLQADGFPSN